MRESSTATASSPGAGTAGRSGSPRASITCRGSITGKTSWLRWQQPSSWGAIPRRATRPLPRFAGCLTAWSWSVPVNGVRWYEDSKATNVGSVEKALASFDGITLIAGGKDKGGSYAPLAELVRTRVRHMVLIGEAKERIAAELGLSPTLTWPDPWRRQCSWHMS